MTEFGHAYLWEEEDFPWDFGIFPNNQMVTSDFLRANYSVFKRELGFFNFPRMYCTETLGLWVF